MTIGGGAHFRTVCQQNYDTLKLEPRSGDAVALLAEVLGKGVVGGVMKCD